MLFAALILPAAFQAFPVKDEQPASIEPAVPLPIITPVYLPEPTVKTSSIGYQTASSNLSFLILGDWGNVMHTAQEQQNAAAMNNVVSAKGAAFVVTTGDNFYDDGVYSVTDNKWSQLWLDIYTGALGTLDWWVTLGNHDWTVSPESEIEYSGLHPRWVMPYYYSERTAQFGEYSAAFIFIDSNLLEYGYEVAGNPHMSAMFASRGWSAQNHTLEKQLDWIESKLQLHNDKDFVFVLGHHVLGTCAQPMMGMQKLDILFKKYRPTAYLFGHHHNMQFAKSEYTMYVQSGAGHESTAKICPEAQWGSNANVGFVYATLDGTSKSATFQYIDLNGKILFTAQSLPRVRNGLHLNKSLSNYNSILDCKDIIIIGFLF